MHTRILAGCFLLCVLMGCGDRDVPMAAAPAPDDTLRLSTPRRAYLLGEPVPLDLTVCNTSKETIKVLEVFISPNYYETELKIARNGGGFKDFRPNEGDDKRGRRRMFTLEPGQTLTYKYRVVGAPLEQFHLAFPKPGDYRVYVQYAFDKASNLVPVTIMEPVGDDAKVWRQLKDPLYLTFLQHERLDDDDKQKQVIMKIVDLLSAHPKSGYASALRHVLSKLAPDLRDSLSFEEATRMGEVLEIKGFAHAEEDPTEKRLDAAWKQPAQDTTYGDILRSLSKASDVPLDAPGKFKATKVSMGAENTTVREYMRSLRGEGNWERRGNGYFLVPFDAKKVPNANKPDPEKKE